METPFGQAIHEFDGDEVQELTPRRVNDISINETDTSSCKEENRRVIASTSIYAFFKGRHNSSEPTIKACLQSKARW